MKQTIKILNLFLIIIAITLISACDSNSQEIEHPAPTECQGMECFEIDFSQCNKATTIEKINDKISYQHEIIATKDNLCVVNTRFATDANPMWKDKSMNCSYDNKLTFNEAFNDHSKCVGPLYDIMYSN